MNWRPLLAEAFGMSTIGWILLIALFVGAHMLMHRGHGSHAGGGRLPRTGHGHGDGENGQATASEGEPVPRRHHGC